MTLVRGKPSLMAALAAARALDLASWAIGAGAVRSLVWDDLHGYTQPTVLADIDLVYFDPSAAPQADAHLQQALQLMHPGVHWEVTNQAHVHHWLADGRPAFGSLEEGIASWPEVATCVGVWRDADENIGVIAPHGLDDLFGLQVRYNPTRAGPATYRQRLAAKQFTRTWPRLRVLQP